MLHKKYKKQEGVPPGGTRQPDARQPDSRMTMTAAASQPDARQPDSRMTMYNYTCVRRASPDLYNDKSAQTVYKACTSPTRRGNDQLSIYTTEGIIRACTAFWRVG